MNYFQPKDFYRDSFKGLKTRGASSNKTIQRGKLKFFNGKYDMEYMNRQEPPTDGEIHAAQIVALKKDFMIDSSIQKYLDDYNNDNLDLNGVTMFEIEHMIQIIEDVFSKKLPEFNGKEGGNSLLTDGIPAEVTQEQLNRYYQILDELVEIHTFFSTKMYSTNPSINQNEFVNKMKYIENAINKLRADLQNGNTSTGGYFTIPEWSKAKSLSNYILLIGIVLKSRLVERKSVDFADSIPKMKGLDASKIYGVTYDIFGNVKSSGKQLRSDVLVFEEGILEKIVVRYMINGQKKMCSLKKFFEVVENASENHVSISITADEQEKLFNASKFAIQSKSGYNQSPFNNFKISPGKAVKSAWRAGFFMEASILEHFILWHNDKYHTKANHEIYNAYFNFCISHDLTRIIGIKNSLIATRKGIYPIVDYMEDQWTSLRRTLSDWYPAEVHLPAEAFPQLSSYRYCEWWPPWVPEYCRQF